TKGPRRWRGPFDSTGSTSPIAVSDRVDIQRDAGAERRRHRTLLDVAALGARRLEANDLLESCADVLVQLLSRERSLADDEVHVGVLVDAELDLSALDLLDGLGRVRSHGAGLRVRHQTAGSEHLSETTDLAHELRGRHGCVEVGPAAGDLLDQLGATDLVGAGGDGRLSSRAVGEHDDAGSLARAVRKHDGAADHLVRLAGVDGELERDLDGRVELRRAGLLRQSDSLGRSVETVCLDLRGGSLVCLGLGSHDYLPQPSTVMPMERAVPAMIFDAASMSFAFRSACFCSAI